MCAADDSARAGGLAFASPGAALRCASAAMDYLNSSCVPVLDGAACGELLIWLGEVQAKLTAAHAGLLRRFDAAGAHDADGYGSSSAWLAAKGQLTRRDARAAVREMRRLGPRPPP